MHPNSNTSSQYINLLPSPIQNQAQKAAELLPVMQINVNVADFVTVESFHSAQVVHQLWDGLTAAIVEGVRISKRKVQKAATEQINKDGLLTAQAAASGLGASK